MGISIALPTVTIFALMNESTYEDSQKYAKASDCIVNTLSESMKVGSDVLPEGSPNNRSCFIGFLGEIIPNS